MSLRMRLHGEFSGFCDVIAAGLVSDVIAVGSVAGLVRCSDVIVAGLAMS